MLFNRNHLKDASEASNQSMGYAKHFLIAFTEFGFCFLIAIGSLLHAIVPWMFNFKLIEWRVKRLKYLKKKFPQDPILQKVEFHD
jgi:hypothetical protein